MTAQVISIDSLRSLNGALGDPARDKRAGVYYGELCLTDDQLLAAYRSTWLARKIVNIPAQDSVRKGRDWQAENDEIELIEAEEKRLGFWQKLLDAKIKARLWGGAAIYIGTAGNPATPLEPEQIGKGGIRYFTVLSRREIIAGELEQDALAEGYGRPAAYQVQGNSVLADVHPSRLVVFIGAPHPDPWIAHGPTRGWGDSALQAVFETMTDANSTASNIASLIFEANVDVFRIPDFMLNLADPRYEARLVSRFTSAGLAKSNIKALLLDKDEEYERKTVSFSTLPDILQQFLILVSGAADIPATRLLGQSPAGLNATGESDIRNYYDHVQSLQELEMRPALSRLDEALIRSALGRRPAEIHYRWAPLWQVGKKEQAEIDKINAETAQIYMSSGLVNPPVLARSVLNRLIEEGTYPGIEAAVDEFGEEPEFEAGEDEEDASEPDAKFERIGDAFLDRRRSVEERVAARGRAAGGSGHFDPGKHPRGNPGNAGQFRETGAEGRQAAERKARVPRELDADDKQAIRKYTAEGYQEVNRHLRGIRDGGDSAKEKIAALDRAMEGASLDEDATLYRGVGSLGVKAFQKAGLKKGSIIVDKAFVSTSRKEATALAFARQSNENVLMEISVRKGAQARDIDLISDAQGEKEVLFARGLRLKVLSWDAKTRRLRVEALND